MADNENKRNVKKYYGLCKFVTRLILIFGKLPIKKAFNLTVEPYKPKHKTFILIANHTDFMDPGYEIIALNQYIRFVAADFIIRLNILTKILLGKFEGVIVKKRNTPSNVLIDEIMENLNAGIPIGLHAEGLLTTNGETGFMPANTGKLVKDSGVALITFRITGGYFRGPRWAEVRRKGPVFGKVVHEYSPEELKDLSVEEINEIIRRDTYVNAYEEQKKEPHLYKGERLAEHVERTLYMCPKCKQVGTLHSHDDKLTCECGYSVIYGEDCFFHPDSGDMVFDNILEWDRWQRQEWKQRLQSSTGLILTEKEQIINKMHDGVPEKLCEDGIINIYPDKFELIVNGESIDLPVYDLKRVQNANKQNIVIVHKNGDYYYIECNTPRTSDKYVAAWYYLTNREYQ